MARLCPVRQRSVTLGRPLHADYHVITRICMSGAGADCEVMNQSGRLPSGGQAEASPWLLCASASEGTPGCVRGLACTPHATTRARPPRPAPPRRCLDPNIKAPAKYQGDVEIRAFFRGTNAPAPASATVMLDRWAGCSLFAIWALCCGAKRKGAGPRGGEWGVHVDVGSLAVLGDAASRTASPTALAHTRADERWLVCRPLQSPAPPCRRGPCLAASCRP